jgi:hypothetical protein
MIARTLAMPAALMMFALCACGELDWSGGPGGERNQALNAFVRAQDEARHQLRLFQGEPHGSCGSEHLAKASAGADANLALLAPGRAADASRPVDADVIKSVETTYGTRPVTEVASLTLDIANAAAEAGCPDQARALYRQILDRYVRPDYAQYRQRAKVGLSAIGGQ